MIDAVNAAGTIASIDCAGATNNGTLTSGTAASGVTSVISYTTGNGGTHTGQTVASTGVTGLTATLASGSFATGAGTLTYTITGTPAASGTASFAINIGGQSCTLTRTIAAPAPPTNPIGTGSLAGKTCFDIALSNDAVPEAGPLSSRISNQSDFTLTATNTQTYTFTPSGTVSNIRFVYINTNGTVIASITGGNTGNNITTAQSATVVYSNNLNTTALGTLSATALTADIYVIYNSGATNNGTDMQLKLTANVKDAQCCGAYVAPGVWKEFMCYNLGADTTLNPNTPVLALSGNFYQWGRSVVAGGITPSNSTAIVGWNTTAAADGSWSDTTKTANDPCPTGYRVPTKAQWMGVATNNTYTRIGTPSWIQNDTLITNAISIGSSAANSTLTLVAAGYRHFSNGYLGGRNSVGNYWSSTPVGGTNGNMLLLDNVNFTGNSNNDKRFGNPIRCIHE